MTWKEEGLKLDFAAKVPECRRVSSKIEGYELTIEKFLESGEEKALIKKPKDLKIGSLRNGLKNTIKRMELEDKVKPSVRDGSLYLFTRDYVEKQGWNWQKKVTKNK